MSTSRSPSGLLKRLRLRTLLSAAAFAALGTAAVLGTLLLITAGSTRSVVETAEQAHARVQTYTRLISAIRAFQVATYADAQERSAETRAALEISRGSYLESLEAALRIPAHTRQQKNLTTLIDQHGRAIVDHLASISEIMSRVDDVWRTEGRHAAGIEAERAGRPVREFEALLSAEVRRGDEEISAATDRALSLSRMVVIASVVCLCLAVASWAIVQYLLSRRMEPRLRRLEESTRALAAGDLSHRVALDGNDELAQLSSAFDTMAAMLAEKQHALRQVQLGLEQAVRARTEALERANRELAASDGRRRAFLTDIGHELRTPLTIIRGEAQVALRTMDQPDFSAQEPFERIIKHTHDVIRMVEDLFLIARAEAGGLPLDIRSVDLREMTQRIAGDFATLVIETDAKVVAVPGPPVIWDADPDRLRRALSALVENALRHTHDQVQVTIEARYTAHGAMITVCDDGPGIDPAIVSDLFQRFRRGHTHGEGSGLGLSVVRALVEVQGGDARLENRPEGGARAVIEFRRLTAEDDASRELLNAPS